MERLDVEGDWIGKTSSLVLVQDGATCSLHYKIAMTVLGFCIDDLQLTYPSYTRFCSNLIHHCSKIDLENTQTTRFTNLLYELLRKAGSVTC